MHVHPSSMDPKMTDRKKVKKLSKKNKFEEARNCQIFEGKK
jgi:hypothetical protein